MTHYAYSQDLNGSPLWTWQTEVAESDHAFINQKGLFEFMPFGLCNAPATFQRLVNLVLQWFECLVYLDDRSHTFCRKEVLYVLRSQSGVSTDTAKVEKVDQDSWTDA